VAGDPLRPAWDEGLEGEALLELELLCDGVEGDDELDGIEGIELCDDCCWLVDSHPARTNAMAPASNHCFDTVVFMMSRLAN